MAYTTIDDPSAYFHTLLYTGNGSDDRNLTNTANAGDFKPDFLWIKQRSATRGHIIVDSNRGATKRLRPDEANAEDTKADHIQAFLTDGFQVGTNNTTNVSSGTYVAWQWKANGGTTTTNDASSTGVGNLDSVYQANTTAGFSVVTWTGVHPGNHNVAHGLGKAPKVIFFKNRSDSASWQVRHGELSAYQKLPLNATTLPSTDFNLGHGSSTTTFALQNSNLDNGDGDSMLAYCFAEIQGYSKFGKYTGNNNADGAFVYTGFKPAWLMVKSTTSTEHWNIPVFTSDANGTVNTLSPNLTNAERTMDQNPAIDFISNGFKIRTSDANYNGNGGTYIYMAFAEHPFVSSEGVPVTAR